MSFLEHCATLLKVFQDFPSGPLAKNSPSNAGDMRLILGLGTEITYAAGQLSLNMAIRESPWTATTRSLEPLLHNKRSSLVSWHRLSTIKKKKKEKGLFTMKPSYCGEVTCWCPQFQLSQSQPRQQVYVNQEASRWLQPQPFQSSQLKLIHAGAVASCPSIPSVNS